MKPLILITLFSILLSGCANTVTLSGHNVSNVDSNLNMAESASIAVVADAAGDELTNKRYLADVVQALKDRGFVNAAENIQNPDYLLRVNFTSESKTDSKKVPIFNNPRNIPHTVCRRNPVTNARTCVTRYRHFMEPIVSGYETVDTPTTVYTFHFTLTDKQKNLLLDSTNTVVHANCSKWKMYEFLANDAIARADFNSPVDKPYAVEMQQDYRCE